MFIFFAIFGLIVLITGIIFRKKLNRKVWDVVIWVGVLSVIISVLLFICTLLLVNRQDNNNPIGSTEPISIGICKPLEGTELFIN